MRISPVGVLSAAVFKGSSSACRVEDIPVRNKETASSKVYTITSSEDWRSSIERQNKERAAADMRNELLKIEREEISLPTRRHYKADIDAMKDSIIDSCLTFDEYKSQGFRYDNAIGNFNDWHSYVEEDREHLSDIKSVPYDIAGEDRVSISSYSEENPDSPEAEILQSSIYMMYKLLKLNKQSRTHFHG